MGNKDNKLEEETKTVEFTRSAVGTYQDTTTGIWFVAIIRFDPVTGTAKVVQRTEAGSSEDFAHEQFKLEAVSLGLV